VATFWKEDKYRTDKKMLNFGNGLNDIVNQFNIKDNELSNSANIACYDYPVIETRKDMYDLLMEGNWLKYALGIRGSYIHASDGTKWYYSLPGSINWTSIVENVGIGVSVATKFVEFRTELYTYTILPNNSTNVAVGGYAYNGTTSLVSLTSNAPKSHLYAVSKVRLFGIDSNKRLLKYTVVGTITDWLGSGSGELDLTNLNGDATAMTEFADHIIIWSNRSMFELYGDRTLNFELVEISNQVGCLGNSAYTEHGGNLYWAAKDGIYVYTGGYPKKISDKIEKLYLQLVDKILGTSYESYVIAGHLNNKLYFMIPSKASEGGNVNTGNILVYDTKYENWFKYNMPNKVETFTSPAININNHLYVANSTKIIELESTRLTGTYNSTNDTFSFETKAYMQDHERLEAVTEMYITHEGNSTATMSVDYTTNPESTSYSSLINSSDLTHSTSIVTDRIFIPIKLQQARRYKFKFSGTNRKKIYNVSLKSLSYGED
jgi:aspartate 1-decarboxylase